MQQQHHYLFDVKVYSQKIYIIPTVDNAFLKTSLIIDRASQEISEVPKVERPEGKFIGSKQVYYFLGILKLQANYSFIVLVDQKERVANIKEQRIYRIKSVSYIPIECERINNNNEVYQILHNQKDLLTKYGFYFSLNGDMTSTRQFRNQRMNGFCWNDKLLSFIKPNNISQNWYLPIIQGYVEQTTAQLEQQQIQVVLISRRSRYMGGTRYHSRGLNDDGHVANFVETEQILIVNNYLFSYVAVRGSVPLFWTQESNMSSIKLTRSQELTNAAYTKHFGLLQKYGKVLCVNLMQKDKAQEQLLTENFEHQFHLSKQEHVKYEFIDFHSLVKGGSSAGLNPKLYNYYTLHTSSFQFYIEDNGTVRNSQMGVFRLNCLDCLDRTNLYMSKIFFIMLTIQLQTVKLKLAQHSDVLDLFDENNKKLQHGLVISFKGMWANNGDMLSRIYAGTNSTVSEMIREGKITGILKDSTIVHLKMKPNSQQLINQSMGQLIIHHNMTHIFKVKRNDTIITWNVNGKEPKDKLFIDTILDCEHLELPDIVVFGLQEMVDLNPQNIMIMSNDKMKLAWDAIFSQNLDQLDKYTRICESNLVGIYLSVYIKSSQAYRVSSIETDAVKTGMGGTLGNKGGTIVTFNLDDTNIVLINSHLTSGNNNVLVRLQDAQEIHEKAFQNSKSKYSIKSADYQFFFGDMNFRIDNSYNEVVAKIQQYEQLRNQNNEFEARQILQELFNQEQLQKVKHINPCLQNYQEGGINFLPTYKYDNNSTVYDTSKKKRTPSWCDRILLQCKEETIFQQHFYRRRECLDSDHRPVTSYYTMEIKKLDKQEYQKVKDEYKQYSQQQENQHKQQINQQQPQPQDQPQLELL